MRQSDRRVRPAHLQLLAVAWNFGWPVAAGVIIGHWIDQSLGSSPVATLGLGIGSMAASVWRLVRLSRIELAEREREEAERRAQEQARRAEEDARRAREAPPAVAPNDTEAEAGDEEALLDELLEQYLEEKSREDDDSSNGKPR